jgi:hypothetical protein
MADPDQTLALLITGHPCKEELFPYILQEHIVKTEDMFQSTVRDPWLALEQPNHGEDQLVEPALCICSAL